jgi:PAS domain S-box-containing protein/putative nucleotidyltransferase with HDIG domain
MKNSRTKVKEHFVEPELPGIHRNSPDSIEKRYLSDMEFLSRAAIDLVELAPEKDIYRFIGDCLFELVGNALILVSSFDETSGSFLARTIAGTGNRLNSLLSLLGRHPIGMTSSITGEAKTALMSNILHKVPGGLYEFAFGSIPKTTCHAIEEIFNLSSVYVAGFAWRGNLFGSAAILLRGSMQLEDTRVIETFISLASVALQRRYAEEELRNAHSELEKRVEERTEELAKERAILENIITLNPYAISIHNVDGYYIKGNQAFIDLFQAPPPPDFSIFDHTVLKKNGYVINFAGLKKGKTVKVPELWYNPRDTQPSLQDKPCFVRSLFFPIMHNNQDIEYIIAMHEDITERKKAKDALEESEQKYRSVVDNANQAIVVIQDDIIVFANPKASRITGFSPDELGSKPFSEIIHPDDRQTVIELHHKNVNREAIPDIYQFRIFGKAGNIIWIEVNAVPIEWKGRPSTLNFATDVTGYKEAEQQMMVKDSAITSSINAVALAYLNGNVTYVNPSFLELWDYKNNTEVLGRPITDFCQSCIEAGQVRKAIIAKGVWVGELAAKRKDESTFNVQLSAHVIKDHEDKPLCIMVSFLDITRRKEAEEKALVNYQRMTRNMEDTIQAMAMTVEYKDRYTASHQKRVAQLARAIADEMGMGEDRKKGLYLAGLVHDIGKLRVPAEILSNPGKLSDAEFSMIKMHPQTGFDILKSVQFQWPLAQIVHQHHERINGTGYPEGIAENDIFLESKILAVADVVEAMASHRPYRPALGINKALQEISQHKGTLYDEKVVNTCLYLFNKKGYQLL